MKEASVSRVFMTALRKRWPGAVVMKHRDASMIGMPDCSITYVGKTTWLEFKLVKPPLKWMNDLEAHQIEALTREMEGAPVQTALMRRLAIAGWALYVVWFYRSQMAFVYHPLTAECFTCRGKHLTEQLVDFIQVAYFNALSSLGESWASPSPVIDPMLNHTIKRAVLAGIITHDFSVATAAIHLGISRMTIYRYLRSWGLGVPVRPLELRAALQALDSDPPTVNTS